MNETIKYIITWLLYGNEEAAAQVGYTADPKVAAKYKVTITPNGYWGKDIVLPDLDNPHVETIGEGEDARKVVDLDIIYNTFFFLSRAEEMVNHMRDEHGRFLAKYSILGLHNRLSIPLLDEYARFLMKALGLELPKAGYNHIYLTHDIDSLNQYRHLRGAIGGIIRGKSQDVLASWRDIHNDPCYTFPWMMDEDHKVIKSRGQDKVTAIYFAKHTNGKGFDYPQYSRHSRNYVRLRTSLKRTGAIIGIHSSYYGFFGETDHHCHRSHYLRCDIENMERLVGSGITDDFTMGFPDAAGFRMQTTRSFRWINPKTWEVTTLMLHPLTVMDCTLYGEKYMNLNEDEAYFFCQRLFDKVEQNHGDLCILWHNHTPSHTPFHFSLYEKLINMLTNE